MARKDVLAQAFITGTIRGAHSTGMFGVKIDQNETTNDNILLYKKDIAGYDFVQLKQTERALNNIEHFKFVIGHHRHATYGQISPQNAHPFSIDNITLVHNGSLTHLAKLTENHHKFSVDSEVLTYAIAAYGYKEILPKLKGAAAIVWYDKKQDSLYLYRNKERPLYFAKIKDEETSFIASEAWMLKGLIWRNGLELETLYEVKENQLLEFKDKALPHSVKIIDPVVEQHIPTVYQEHLQNTYKPREPVKIVVEDVLKHLNLSMGNKIHFIIEKIYPPTSKSKHGKACGYMSNSPYADVCSHGVDMRKYKPKDVVKAEIIGVELAEHRLGPALTVKILKKVGEENSNILHLPFMRGIVNENDNDNKIKGPNNILIPMSEFKKLAESGCDNCQGVVNPFFADKVLWTNARKPICHVCSEKLTNHGAIQH